MSGPVHRSGHDRGLHPGTFRKGQPGNQQIRGSTKANRISANSKSSSAAVLGRRNHQAKSAATAGAPDKRTLHTRHAATRP
ncbi:MAG: hypothetical protein NXI02_29290, partial [Rhodobacteraceae bacterium]|nr:hypothetical protein [Paracoccaceae bacterium]